MFTTLIRSKSELCGRVNKLFPAVMYVTKISARSVTSSWHMSDQGVVS
jgi:hypothetical protein